MILAIITGAFQVGVPVLLFRRGLYFDRYYFLLVVPALILSIYAQFKVSSTFNKYSQIRSRSNYSAEQAARRILNAHGLSHVQVERVPGRLSDHYDPRNKVLRLSDSTHASSSIAAIGVAAHEAGHAIQDEVRFWPNRVRAFLVPIASIGSMAGPYLAFAGLFMRSGFLFNIGILLFGAAVLFYIVTLPVEIDASRRAIKILGETGMLSNDELVGAKKVLQAAALTYIASALTSFASLLRLLLLSRNRR